MATEMVCARARMHARIMLILKYAHCTNLNATIMLLTRNFMLARNATWNRNWIQYLNQKPEYQWMQSDANAVLAPTEDSGEM